MHSHAERGNDERDKVQSTKLQGPGETKPLAVAPVAENKPAAVGQTQKLRVVVPGPPRETCAGCNLLPPRSSHRRARLGNPHDSNPPPTPRHCPACRRGQRRWVLSPRPAEFLSSNSYQTRRIDPFDFCPRPRSVFPFRLRRQAIGLAGLLRQPFGVGHGVLPGDINDRAFIAAPGLLSLGPRARTKFSILPTCLTSTFAP
jgi:hypothetical protein